MDRFKLIVQWRGLYEAGQLRLFVNEALETGEQGAVFGQTTQRCRRVGQSQENPRRELQVAGDRSREVGDVAVRATDAPCLAERLIGVGMRFLSGQARRPERKSQFPLGTGAVLQA